jgi:hypothetical protein
VGLPRVGAVADGEAQDRFAADGGSVGQVGGDVDGQQVRARLGEDPVGVGVGVGLDPERLRERTAGVPQHLRRAEVAGLQVDGDPAGPLDAAQVHRDAAGDGLQHAGILGVPADPDDVLLLGLRDDVHVGARPGTEERVRRVVRHLPAGAVADAQDGVGGRAPHRRDRRVVVDPDRPLAVPVAGSDVDVAGLQDRASRRVGLARVERLRRSRTGRFTRRGSGGGAAHQRDGQGQREGERGGCPQRDRPRQVRQRWSESALNRIIARYVVTVPSKASP